MKKVFFALLTLVLISCNNEKPKVEEKLEATEEKVVIVKPSKLIFNLTLKSSQTDFINLFASNVFINNNRTMNIVVTEKLNKSEVFNSLILDFPENIKPDYQVGVNLGTQNTKSIEIESIEISYGETQFSIKSNELNDYFTFNKFVEYNSETATITTKKVDGKLNPILFLRKKIIDQL